MCEALTCRSERSLEPHCGGVSIDMALLRSWAASPLRGFPKVASSAATFPNQALSRIVAVGRPVPPHPAPLLRGEGTAFVRLGILTKQ